MTDTDFSSRLKFDTEKNVMEVDFSELIFRVPNQVHRVYDEIEEQLTQSGKKWFFLVNYRDCKIMSEAWIAFAHRGKMVNLSHSLGSVRFSAEGETGDEILERSREENFDPNLFDSREAAIDHLMELRAKIPDAEFEAALKPSLPSDSRTIDERITFHNDISVMEVDFSSLSFATTSDVNRIYDGIASQLQETGKKWYFIVNYADTEVLPEAWYTWSERGKKLNQDFSLGTVRFDPREETRQKILKRARADEFNPNLVANREEALQRVEDMRKTQM
ncbi:MAG: hypothetical protein ACR2O8_02650 [Rhizobiaceae bacterium]